MSLVKEKSFEKVSELIQHFNEYEEIFTPTFLHYNGKTEIVSLQYRLRTFKSFMKGEEFLENLLEQYLKNQIQIPSEFFSVQINDQNSLKNFALDPKYFINIEDFYIFHLSNLFNLDSEYINIIIDSKFKIDIESLIVSKISKQPKLLSNNVLQYELTSVLKTSQFPEKFQFLNIPIRFNLVLNNYLEYFIQKRFLGAADKWFTIATFEKGSFRKKNEYSRMIRNRFGINPLEFNKRIQRVLENILTYIQDNYYDVININNLTGILKPKVPKGYRRADKTGILEIGLGFETNFDNNQYTTHSLLIFDFNWMRKIFKNYFKL